MHQHGLLYSLRGQRGNSIAVARSPVTRSAVQQHRLVPRPASIARAMASAGRARAARKSIMMLTFCVRRSPGDSAAATGWSG